MSKKDHSINFTISNVSEDEAKRFYNKFEKKRKFVAPHSHGRSYCGNRSDLRGYLQGH